MLLAEVRNGPEVRAFVLVRGEAVLGKEKVLMGTRVRSLGGCSHF